MTAKTKNLSAYAEFSGEDAPDIRDMTFAIAVADWNPEVTEALLNGALNTLSKHGADMENNVHVRHVPGSFELPQAASLMIEGLMPDAVICLGSIIQGETRHFEFIAQAVAQSCLHVSADSNIPVIFGVLTTDTHEQAIERAGGSHGNKGDEAAAAAIRMAALKVEMDPIDDDIFFDNE